MQDNLKFSLSYSFLSMDLAGPPSSSQAIAATVADEESPRNQFSLRSQWDVTQRVSFDTTMGFVDSLPGFSLHSYWRFDARLGWRVTDQVEVDLVGQNLLQASHVEWGAPTALDSTAVGRSFYGKVTWRF